MQPRTLATLRLVVGLLQGLVLYLLFESERVRDWPANDVIALGAIMTTVVFVPTVIVAGLGNLRSSVLIAWALIAAGLCSGLGAYNAIRGPLGQHALLSFWAAGPLFWVPVAAVVFIAHSIIVAGESERRLVASYPQYFAISWKHGVQIILAAGFLLAFWATLILGANLLALIKISFLTVLIRTSSFAIMASTFVLAYAIHVTDVRATLVVGVRTLKLALLSWLLPLLTVLVVVFLVSLATTGLESLWSTKRATFILLSALAATVFLINATYQDGRLTVAAPLPLAISRFVAALTLLPLVALAGYALMLRINQYGMTPQRVLGVAAVLVAFCYAAGYAYAALRSRLILRQLEITNEVAACVIVVVIVALLSPIADPIRISVDDQVGRLLSGRTPPEKFDYAFLRFGAGAYGIAALGRVQSDTKAPSVADQATKALGSTSRSQFQQKLDQATPQDRIANIKLVAPAGGVLPASFTQQEWSVGTQTGRLPRCLVQSAKCEAILADLDGDGDDEIIVYAVPTGTASAFVNDGGVWKVLGRVSGTDCKGVREALRAGSFSMAPSYLQEVEVNGQRLRVDQEDCAKTVQAPNPLPNSGSSLRHE